MRGSCDKCGKPLGKDECVNAVRMTDARFPQDEIDSVAISVADACGGSYCPDGKRYGQFCERCSATALVELLTTFLNNAKDGASC